MLLTLRAAAVAFIAFTTWSARCNTLSDDPNASFVLRVRIEPSRPRHGETIRIISEVTNVSRDAERGTFAMCGLGITGTLAVADPVGIARCAGVSEDKTLAPGETERAVDTKVVDSPAGTYVLEVHHLLNPALTEPITVRVSD
jgi:hypothetical protein